MVLREFTYGVDNVTATITKEDKNNVDTMTLNTDFNVKANVGDEINFYDENNDLAFAGYIENKSTTGKLVLDCEDYGSVLKHSITNEIFVDKLAEEIIESVITSAGLTYVSSITTTETIDTYTANKKNSLEIVEELADKLLANYTTDVNKNFKLELEGGIISTKTINNNKATIDGAWEEDLTEVINDIYVEGDSRSIFSKEEEFSGTGSQTEFTLKEIPLDIKVEYPVGTILTGYVEGQTTGDYKKIRDQKKCIFDLAPSSGTDNILISYTYSIPVSIRRRNKSSKELYGLRSDIIRKSWIINREDARSYASYIIENFSSPLINSSWFITSQSEIVDWQSYLPNQQVYVDDDLRGYQDYYIIRKVVKKYGTGTSLKITLGSSEVNMALWDKQVAYRIRQLEDTDDNSTILNQDEFVLEEMKLYHDGVIDSIERKTISSDTFYLLEDDSGVRNQMKEDGSGPIMREVGYTSVTTDDSSSVKKVTITYMDIGRASLILSLSSVISYLAVGDDDTEPVITDIILGNETYRDLLFDTISTTSSSINMNIYMDSTENNVNDILEVGAFDSSSSGNMFNRSLTNEITKNSSTEVFIEIQYNILIANEID